jgi:hypothetical protein
MRTCDRIITAQYRIAQCISHMSTQRSLEGDWRMRCGGLVLELLVLANEGYLKYR